jgi:hypothetical protein
VPGPPRSVVASPGDSSAHVSWAAPATDGGEPLLGYDVVATDPYGGRRSVRVPASPTRFDLGSLYNGVQYGVTVRAVNALGVSTPGGPATVTPYEMLPSVSVAAPAAGATLRGVVTLDASAAPHPLSGTTISWVDFYVDGQHVTGSSAAPWQASFDTTQWPNGGHALTARAFDGHYRYTLSEPVPVTFANPFPEVAITTPASGGTYDTDSIAFEAAAAVPAGWPATITRVEYRDGAYGTLLGSATAAPYRVVWDTRLVVNGWRSVVAAAYDSTGLAGRSAAVQVLVSHPPPTVTLVPAESAVVHGASVTLTADAQVTAAGSAVARVDFYADGRWLGADSSAPYTATWDTSAVTYWHSVSATVVETSGRSASTWHSVLVDNVLPAADLTSPRPWGAVDPVPLTLSGTLDPGATRITSVEARVDGVAVPATSDAAAGTWRAAYDATGRYGRHEVLLLARDADGLVGTRTYWFDVRRPVPVLVSVSPAADSVVAAGSVLDLTARVAPAPYQTTTVAHACFSVGWYEIGCAAPDADGVVRVPWTVTQPSGHNYVVVRLSESDGTLTTPSGYFLRVARPPQPPGVAVAEPGLDGTVTVRWVEPPETEPVPVTGYVVTAVATGEARTFASGPGSTTFTGLPNGVWAEFAVAAVNVVGTGEALYAGAVPGTPTFVEQQPSSSRIVTYGTRVAVVADLREARYGAGVAGRTVELVAHPYDGVPAVVGRAVTDAYGRARLPSYLPRARVRIYTRFAGSGRYLPSNGPGVTIQVRAAVSATLSATRVPAGSGVRLTGRVGSARPGQPVYLQRWYDGAWHAAGSAPESATGAVSFVLVKPRGTYWYRLVYSGALGLLTGYSPTRSFQVG